MNCREGESSVFRHRTRADPSEGRNPRRRREDNRSGSLESSGKKTWRRISEICLRSWNWKPETVYSVSCERGFNLHSERTLNRTCRRCNSSHYPTRWRRIGRLWISQHSRSSTPVLLGILPAIVRLFDAILSCFLQTYHI